MRTKKHRAPPRVEGACRPKRPPAASVTRRQLEKPVLWRATSPARCPPGFIEPCLPTLGHAMPTGPQWAFEIKHDGFRFICRRDGDRVRVFSRRGNDYTDRVPTIAKALAALRVKSVTLDGEGVVCREDGVSDFDRLRAAVGRMGSRDAFLYAFDLLEINGTDLRRDAWHVRRATLASLLRKRRSMASSFRSSRRRGRRRGVPARLRSASRASSPSAAIGPIGPAARPIGSRSRTRMRSLAANGKTSSPNVLRRLKRLVLD